MKIIAITVTYNRLSWLKKNVEAILHQSYKPDEFIIIDNKSTDGTIEFLQDLEKKEKLVKIVYLSKNVGGAGGFATGFEEAYNDGMDYVWGMDDDAIPHFDALEKLVDATKLYAPSEYCLRGNTYFMDDNNKFVGEQFTESESKQCLNFVGFFVPREIVKKIGFPRRDLFIYYDDEDYSLSILENGYKIKTIRESIIEHPYIMPDNKHNFLGRSICVPDMPKWKIYYWMRNNLLIRKNKSQRKYKFNLRLELYVLLKLLIFNPSLFGMAFKGFYHGIQGKSGHLRNCP